MEIQTIGQFVENCMLYGFHEPLSEETRGQIIDFSLRFEESMHSRSQLQDMDDKDLIRAAYFAMADYARGQM